MPFPQQDDPAVDVPRERRQRRIVRELLGFDRWRRLEAARFDFDLHEHGFTPKLSDNPARQEKVEEIFMSNILRLSQKRVQRSLRLMERRDDLRAKLRGRELDEGERHRAGLDVSPGVRFGTSSSFGAKIRLRGLRSWFWSGTSLRLRRELNGPNASVKLSFRDGHTSSYLVYHTEHKKRGEAVEFGIRHTF